MLDIDHFKRVNDDYGHQAGDRALERLAAIVMQELREADRLGRYGGEEFLIVTPGINRVQAAALAERLRQRIAQETFDAIPRMTCSFGVCELEGDNADSLVRRADELLYEAKHAGRNSVIAR
jgi:diguanylate cyclase (GGDEF)-like protein